MAKALSGWVVRPLTTLLRVDAPSWEYVNTGNVELIVVGPGGYSGDRYRDAKTIPVEDKLPRVLRAIEIHRLQEEWRAQEREREATDRLRHWEAAMVEGRDSYDEHARWVSFEQRSRQWHEVAMQRQFLAAARDVVTRQSGPERDSLVAHLDLVERRLDGLDPVRHPELILPSVPEPKPEEPKPFLHGRSPPGPEGYGPWAQPKLCGPRS